MIDLFLRHLIPAAYAVLPPVMNSPAATAMLLAICLQESKFLHRRQLPRRPGGAFGPARGFPQFEQGTPRTRGGITGVMLHPKTREPLGAALTELRYASAIGDAVALHAIVEHNDVVAAVFARLLLWTVPGRLPTRHQTDRGWAQYLAGWRPGDPHPETWHAYYAESWHRVDQLEDTMISPGTTP